MTEVTSSTQVSLPGHKVSDSRSILEIFQRHRRYFIIVPGVLAVLAFGLSFLLPNTYTAETQFIATELLKSDSATGLSQRLQGMAARLGAGGLSPTSSLTEMLPALSKGRELLDGLLDSSVQLVDGTTISVMDLLNPGGDSVAQRRENGRKYLRDAVFMLRVEDTSGVATLQATLQDPQAAAGLANACVQALQEKTRSLYTGSASEQVQFISGRLDDVGAQLKDAEEHLVTFREKNRLANQSPQLRMEEGRLARKVELQEQLYMTLETQLELAKIEQAKNTSVLSIIDKAVAPPKPSGPRRLLIALSVFMGVVAVSAVYFILRDSPSTS